MSKKSIILCLCFLGVLLFGVGVCVFLLYNSNSIKAYNTDQAIDIVNEKYSLTQAVPSDALMLYYSNNFKDILTTIADSSQIVGSVFTDTDKPNFTSFIASANRLYKANKLKSIKNSTTTLSLHYVGNIAPLLIIKTDNKHLQDASVLIDLADSYKLYSSIIDCATIVDENNELSGSSIVLISSSQALCLSAKRHLEGGNSILQSKGFIEALSSINGHDAICISHNYSPIIFNTFCCRQISTNVLFFKKYAQWSAFMIVELNNKEASLTGVSYCDALPSYYLNVIKASGAGENQIAEFLPNYTISALSISPHTFQNYIDAYKAYLDANGNLNKFNLDIAALKAITGVKVEEWAKNINIQEVGVCSFKYGKGIERVQLLRFKGSANLLLKNAKFSLKELKSTAQLYPYSGYADILFGKAFSVEDETYFTLIDNWLVIGSECAVNAYREVKKNGKTLVSNLLEANLSSKIDYKNVAVFAYIAFSDSQEGIKNYFKPGLELSIKNSLLGKSYYPIIFTIKNNEGNVVMAYNSVKMDTPIKGVENAVLLDTVVIVDKGPYPVKNSETKKLNSLAQALNMSISLRDDKGKSQWAIPFSKPICGKVESIDYFSSGKIQYLFAAGESLYLLDRLGRMVKPFPIALGKEVLLGPKIYDFTGTKGYSAMLLFKDNTISMVNLQGKKIKNWQDIHEKDKILRLPELLKVGSNKYWAVRTSRQTNIYPFSGGASVTNQKEGKMLRPDTEIIVKNNNSIIVNCVDGKQRTIKLK